MIPFLKSTSITVRSFRHPSAFTSLSHPRRPAASMRTHPSPRAHSAMSVVSARQLLKSSPATTTMLQALPRTLSMSSVMQHPCALLPSHASQSWARPSSRRARICSGEWSALASCSAARTQSSTRGQALVTSLIGMPRTIIPSREARL